MHIHILGICGTFMAGLAVLAKQMGHTVSGSDAGAYPPMSTQLEAQGILCRRGYSPEHLDPPPDYVIIGNVMSRGNPAVEYIFNHNIPYISGAQWLAENVLRERWVLAVAGTHGKTTTTSMVAWILEHAQLSPGFLIGGVPENFGVSARLGEEPFFVVEADEYDTAFFDKRSKFVHYHPRTLILNNLEFDHADIFPDLAAIQRQFHHLVRTVPGLGLIIRFHPQASLTEVIQQGCWTPLETFGNEDSDWSAKPLVPDCSHFEVFLHGESQGQVRWGLLGQHNVYNALAAIAAARHVGVPVAIACQALCYFQNVKRRLELKGEVNGVKVYDDFAHHPTAIATTIDALRRRVDKEYIIAVLEPRSNSMKMGVYKDTLAPALKEADTVMFYQPDNLNWSIAEVAKQLANVRVFKTIEALVRHLAATARRGDHILIMSNGDFDNIHLKLLETLKK